MVYQAATIPWSGWYWPTSANPPPLAAPGGPLSKFEQYIQAKHGVTLNAVQWEQNHHYNPGCGWCGHCHGWSAASILEDEPELGITALSVAFGVGDVKGLITEAHCTDHLDLWLGTRGWGNQQDTLDALDFHKALLDWVRNGEPVVMDMTNTPSVWNYPVYKYDMVTTPDAANPNKTHIACQVWYASDGVAADYVGVSELTDTLHYWITGSLEQPTGGDWEQANHPGFIWHPDYANANHPSASPAAKYLSDMQALIVRKWKKWPFKVLFLMPKLKWPIKPLPPDREPDDLFNPLLFRGLVARDALDGRIVPALATAWEVTDGGLTHTFHLRGGVTFHNGMLLTAGDVAFSYRAMLDPALDSPHRAALEESIAAIDVLDEHALAFRLRQPLEHFAAAHGWHWVFPQRAVEEMGWRRFARHPIGAGPFAFEGGQDGHFAALVPHDGYFLGAPRLTSLLFLEVPDPARRLEMLQQGQGDVGVFDYSRELEQQIGQVPYLRAVSLPRDQPVRLEVQNLQVQGRIPNQFDGGGNAQAWGVDQEPQQGPGQRSPAGPYQRPVHGRQPQHPEFDPEATLPQWRVGTWWQVEVRQRALQAMVPDPGWNLPAQMLFEVVAEEVVQDVPCFRVRITYPDRPRRADYQFGDVWFSVEQRRPVQGLRRSGPRTIPMDLTFVMQVLRATPLQVDRAGEPRAVRDRRWPDAAIELPAFATRTPSGGTRLASLAVPFPLLIEETDYVIELIDWDR